MMTSLKKGIYRSQKCLGLTADIANQQLASSVILRQNKISGFSQQRRYMPHVTNRSIISPTIQHDFPTIITSAATSLPHHYINVYTELKSQSNF